MTKYPEGQLKAKCKDFSCFEIEAMKKEICAPIPSETHNTARTHTRDGNRITSWSERHHFTSGSERKFWLVDVHFLTKPTDSPTTRNFSVEITFHGDWGTPRTYEKLKSILEKNGFELEKDKWPFADRTSAGFAASREMEKRITHAGWPVQRNF